MAKNLYRLQCPVASDFNTETRDTKKEGSYIELLPLDGIEQTPQKSEEFFEKSGIKLIYYKTNNPDLFWERP
jgi:hypothetical protein